MFHCNHNISSVFVFPHGTNWTFVSAPFLTSFLPWSPFLSGVRVSIWVRPRKAQVSTAECNNLKMSGNTIAVHCTCVCVPCHYQLASWATDVRAEDTFSFQAPSLSLSLSLSIPLYLSHCLDQKPGLSIKEPLSMTSIGHMDLNIYTHWHKSAPDPFSFPLSLCPSHIWPHPNPSPTDSLPIPLSSRHPIVFSYVKYHPVITSSTSCWPPLRFVLLLIGLRSSSFQTHVEPR